ncbi:MAG: hypothetical protein PHW85_03195 [Bacteroidales bacterium]|jgi:hypothetical protein|nr:hypothetical protein [Bacteroidales bacterium]MDD4420580.1 hypothetical protein [Bacteroidales bacterium]
MKTTFLKSALILAVAAIFAFTANDAFAQIGNGAAPSNQQQKNSGGSSTRRTTGGVANGAAKSNQNRNTGGIGSGTRPNNKGNNNNLNQNYGNNNGGIGSGARPNNNNRHPKYIPGNSNRRWGYNPFSDGRQIHRPAPIHRGYEYGSRFYKRPRGAYYINAGGYDFYFWNGIWYRGYGNYYGISRPPVGTLIARNLISSILYAVDYVDTYYYGYRQPYYVDAYGNYYTPVNSYYMRVVNAPTGSVLYDLPSDYQEVNYNGRTYYAVGSTIYEYVYINDNSYYFRAVGVYE